MVVGIGKHGDQFCRYPHFLSSSGHMVCVEGAAFGSYMASTQAETRAAATTIATEIETVEMTVRATGTEVLRQVSANDDVIQTSVKLAQVAQWQSKCAASYLYAPDDDDDDDDDEQVFTCELEL
eukprot:355973-Amphidinium_carterae.1